ncbi:MAG TPA: HAMP domain-containing sensor histidine kinase [Gammaproteobacteria bacterium]
MVARQDSMPRDSERGYPVGHVSLADEERRIEEFLATLAHELRNPLSCLRTAMDLVEALLPDEPRARELKGMIRRQLNHLFRLVEDLSDASSILEGRVVLKTERLDLRQVLFDAVEVVAPLMTERQHLLASRMPESPLYLKGDGMRLTQLVVNLLNNAAKFTPVGGRIEIGLDAQDEHAVIVVRDNGIGIDPVLLPRLFDRLVQARPSGAAGMGLGLPLVRQIAELHGGSVAARSDGIGKGSEFVVRLPLRDSPKARLRASH